MLVKHPDTTPCSYSGRSVITTTSSHLSNAENKEEAAPSRCTQIQAFLSIYFFPSLTSLTNVDCSLCHSGSLCTIDLLSWYWCHVLLFLDKLKKCHLNNSLYMQTYCGNNTSTRFLMIFYSLFPFNYIICCIMDIMLLRCLQNQTASNFNSVTSIMRMALYTRSFPLR